MFPAVCVGSRFGMANDSWYVPPWLEYGLEDPDVSFLSTNVDRGADAWHKSQNGHTVQDSDILEPLQEEFEQIKSRKRVRDLAEVFTNKREIDAMLAIVQPAFNFLDAKFLEPAAGNGNFLLEILQRKLSLVAKEACKSQDQYEHRLLRALASIYGVDISDENVSEARTRLAHAVITFFQTDAPGIRPTDGFLHAAAIILGSNIVLGDSLHRAVDIELCEWVPTSGARFQRRWSPALVAPKDRDLFWSETVQDKEPIHYSQLMSESHSHEIHVLKPGAYS